ncbi:hypothetical protein PhCBS80983_g04168 [Powellomyces hirtus]|uniref:Uncharacterized protein n=1 Tax=Powellomyces hirtus TaxID=109895 RepID=A0A507DZH3_9FUNG|nr:ankyrin repeat-containing domain protein [Powellomyces hirtus]TPX56956.1 hypothetical protein PhCBS80983_g04168 [Powellomyces hirtus]
MTAPTAPTAEFDVQEFVTSARYGDLDGVKEVVDAYMSSTHATSNSATLRTLYTCALPNGTTALHQASANGHVEILNHLLPHLTVGDVNAVNEDGSSALHWAALNGKIDCVTLLIECGADATLQNDQGRSAVTVAEQQGHMDVVNLLLKSFEPEESGDEDETAAVRSSVAAVASEVEAEIAEAEKGQK